MSRRPKARSRRVRNVLSPLRGLVVTWTLMLLTAGLGWTMTGLFAGQTWRGWFAGPAIGMVALLGILRLVGLPRVLVPLAGLVGTAALMVGQFADGTAGLGGFMPTLATLRHWGDLLDRAGDLIVELSCPAPFGSELMFVTVLAAAGLGLALDWLVLGLRRPGLGALLALVACLVPASFVLEGLSFRALAATAAAVLAMLWAATPSLPVRWTRPSARQRQAPVARRRRRSLAVRAAAGLTVMVAASLGPWAVGHSLTGWTHGPLVDALPKVMVFANGPDPLLDLGQDLGQRLYKEALRITTASANPPYLRMTTVSDFTGERWQRRQSEPDLNITYADGRLDIPREFPDESMSVPATMTIAVTNMRSNFLPLPEYPRQIAGLAGQWQVDADDAAVQGVPGQARGQRYTVSARVLADRALLGMRAWGVTQIDFEGQQLSGQVTANADGTYTIHSNDAETGESRFSTFRMAEGGSLVKPDLPAEVLPNLELPDDLPPIITETAKAVTPPGDLWSDLQQAVTLEAFFSRGDFTYSTATPVREGFDGDGVDAIAEFLEVKSGYCIHFASAMAVMARAIGIPSRVALGFLPGRSVGRGLGGRVTYSVTSEDLHAWPELYLSGFGWVSFEPTPGRGVTPGTGDLSEPNPTVTRTANPSPSLSPSPSRPSASPNSSPVSPKTTGQHGFDWTDLKVLAGAIGLGLIVGLLLVLPGLIRWRRRRRRLKRVRQCAAGWLPAAWAEVCDSARDLGLAKPERLTPRELAASLVALWSSQAAPPDVALARLVDAVETAAFAPPGPGPGSLTSVSALTSMLTAMRSAATRQRRWRARIWPTSLFTPNRTGTTQPLE